MKKVITQGKAATMEGMAPAGRSTGELSLSEAAQWERLTEAYIYTFPLVVMDASMRATTCVSEPDCNGHGPVNQLIHSQKLADADYKLVVTPNVDTIYTPAWLDLSREPMVFTMPETVQPPRRKQRRKIRPSPNRWKRCWLWIFRLILIRPMPSWSRTRRLTPIPG